MVEAVHPMCRRRSSGSPFHFQGTREGIAVIGEIDNFNGLPFTTALCAASGATRNPIVLDFIGVDFAGVDAMYRLATFATAMADQNRLVVLRDALPIVRRAWDLVAATMKAEISFV
jgi:anti-anti-sigma regulatory factor